MSRTASTEERIEWMLGSGKNPNMVEGHSYSTAKNRMNRLYLLYRPSRPSASGLDPYAVHMLFEESLSVAHLEKWVTSLGVEDQYERLKRA
jgi:hypothetical protein